ncbi:hypothetical protein BGW80DRAFT_1447827 [Lactifluus volemus]|nr:hypothetical protein BGW80DRAFT_1447827 [Lactifluus volemus]
MKERRHRRRIRNRPFHKIPSLLLRISDDATAYLQACDDIVSDFRRDTISRDDATVSLLQRADSRCTLMHSKMQKMRTSRQGEKVTDSVPPTPIVTMRSINPETVDVHEGNDITMTMIPQMTNRIHSISPESVDVRVGSDGGTTTIPHLTNLTRSICRSFRSTNRCRPRPSMCGTVLLKLWARPEARQEGACEPRTAAVPHFSLVLISNTYVDLNKLFDFHFATDRPSKRSVQHFGQFDIVTNECAWDSDRYQEAVVFLYPHRAREVTAYAKHIVETFIAVGPFPDRVIRYDKRVRSRVVESVGLLLSDTAAFNSDYTQFINCPKKRKGTKRSQ